MKKWYAGLVVVMVLALATSVWAFGPRGGGAGFGGAGLYAMGPGSGGAGPGAKWAQLNLSKEQMDKMWQMREKFRSDTQGIRYELFQKRLEMKKLFADPKADEATILAKQKEMNTLRQQMQDKMVQHRLEQRKVLTPEQIQKLGEGGFGPGMGGRGHGRMGSGGFGPGSGPGYKG
jgi:Spy/CpxP family protein refolding chaperone